MTKSTVDGRNISVCVLYYMALTSSFAFAAEREKSAHFCRYRCAPDRVK